MSASDDDRRLIDSFQQTMTAFLDTQKEVMLAFLDSSSRDGSVDHLASELSASSFPVLEPIPDLTGAHPAEPPSVPVERPPDPSDRSRVDDATAVADPIAAAPVPIADPTPDSTNGLVAGHTPDLGDDAAVVSPVAPDADQVSQSLLSIVEDRTGYPQEMLDLDLQMEADLGMDSIKRVEIIGTLQRTLRPDAPLDAAVMDELIRAKTLRALVDGFAGTVTARSATGGADHDTADREGDRAPV